jgi:cell division protease FtsH
VFFGPDAVTSGAGSDLLHATSVARRMVAEFGMSEEVGLVSADPSVHGGHTSAQLEGQVDTAMRALIRRQAERAESVVREHRGAVEALASALLAHDSLDAAEVHAIARAHAVPLSAITAPSAPALVA